MAKEHAFIAEELAGFIRRQPVFFVATAAAEGRVNLSPKGLDGSFCILGPRQVAFLNLTGSGNETAAHLRVNPLITLMFCGFDGEASILRLYGAGRAVHPRDSAWPELDAHFPDYAGKRQIVTVEVSHVVTSCGFGVPRMDLVSQRPTLPDWAGGKGEAGIRDYWRDKNQVSFDGLPTGILEEGSTGILEET